MLRAVSGNLEPDLKVASFLTLLVVLFVSGCIPWGQRADTGSSLANHVPSIVSLEAKQDAIYLLDSCLVECIASDQDGDDLTYEWSASGGYITGEGASVAWTAPEVEGTYTVTVMVSDAEAGGATESVDINVKRRGSGCRA